jgi:hypothetical protein
MNFLDKSGLLYLWTKIKANFGTTIVNVSDYRTKLDNTGKISIPFVANHQIVNMDLSRNINVCDWFQKASKGGILEIVFAGAQGGNTFCYTNNNNYMYKMEVLSHGPMLNKIEYLQTEYDTYARLIKIYDTKLVVAEFVKNK